MTNEEKILSMLDLIASEVKGLKETSATKDDIQEVKDELRGFKEQTNHRFDQIDDRFNKLEADNNAAYEEIIAKIDKQSESFEGKIDVLNDRLFRQEAQVKILRKKGALQRG